MARHNELGIEGEEIACHYLEEKGYVILERNWRSGKHEIDIVVSKDKELVFVEVKTRSEAYTKKAIEAAYSRKINFLAAAANHYLQGHDTGNMQPRFDFITIVYSNGHFNLEHMEDAFFPPLRGYR